MAAAVAAIASIVAFGAARADVRVADADGLAKALRSAGPGTRILVAPGDYPTVFARGVAGAEGRPVAIVAADPAEPPVFRAGMQLSAVAHVDVEGLVFAGAESNGLNVDDAGEIAKPSHHVVLRDLAVRDVGGRANADGIKLSGVADFRVERCIVERWGRRGSAIDMVGCHRGAIEDCTFRDRADDAAASGVQMKGGSTGIAVRRCRFEDAGERAVNLGGSTGLEYFRPPFAGYEARDVTVEGCTFTGSLSPVAFVGVDGATFRFNTIRFPRKWVARVLQEDRAEGFIPCRGGTFADNLVVLRAADVATAVNVGPDTAPETFRFARNWWFWDDAPDRAPPALPVPEDAASGGSDPRFRDAAHGDLRLAEGSPAQGHGADALPGSR